MAQRHDPLWVSLGAVAGLTALFGAYAWPRASGTPWALAVALWALTMAVYLGAGYTPAFDAWRAWIFRSPGRVYLFPAILFIGYLVYAKLTGTLAEGDLLLAVAFLLVPVEMARRETQPWRTQDALLGWIALLIPLLAPLPGRQSLPMEVGQRVGAWLLPLVLYVALARRQPQGVRLLLGMMYLWYSVEFDALPRVPLPLADVFTLYALALAIYLLMLAAALPQVGLGLSLRPREAFIALREFALFLPLALVIGVLTGFVRLHWGWPGWQEALLKAVAIFTFTGLPEEILFRGVLHRFIAEHMSDARHALALSSAIFGLAHVNNPPMVGVYVVLATLAGWFYGRAYVITGRLTAAALVHTAVNWVWSTFG